jgi:hypothetical protein
MTKQRQSRMVEFYLDRYLEARDDDAYHSLRELGGDCIYAVASRFDRENTESKIRLIRIAQEIRDPRSTEFLVQIASDSDLPIWQAALEGLAYQAPSNLPAILRQLLVKAARRVTKDERAYLRELLRSL